MSEHGNSSIKAHHSHRDHHPHLVPHDQREYITHGTRWDSCRTLSNCCCHPHLPLRACDIHHTCWSHHLLRPVTVQHYSYQAPLHQNGLRVEVHVPEGIAETMGYCLVPSSFALLLLLTWRDWYFQVLCVVTIIREHVFKTRFQKAYEICLCCCDLSWNVSMLSIIKA